ncbi:MAG: DoxX family protein [Acidimicrobiales bacterium]
MKIALDIVAGLLGLAALASAVGKLNKAPAIVESLTSVGVTPPQIPLLASLEILGVLGLVVGIWIRPLGDAASLGFALYFLGAVSSHLRVRAKLHELATPGLLLVIAILTAVLEFKR